MKPWWDGCADLNATEEQMEEVKEVRKLVKVSVGVEVKQLLYRT